MAHVESLLNPNSVYVLLQNGLTHYILCYFQDKLIELSPIFLLKICLLNT